ncbi:MAG: hypothetical protein OXG84_19030 [Chloroflexi bacterium]|nr:hypothetical protein [Chloroflexota bacterium]
MPKRAYTPDEKKLVRRLLLLHQGNVPIVQHLTGYPRRTIEHWRAKWDDDYELYTDAFAQNLLARANTNGTALAPSSADEDSDSAIAQAPDPFAQYAQLRAKLMEHTMTLADNLMLGDGFLNQRVHALTRLLDRLLTLDGTLPDKQPEQTVRFEFHYDDAVQDKPPWDGASTYDGAKQYNERHLREMKKRMDESLANDFPDEYASDSAFRHSAEPKPSEID